MNIFNIDELLIEGESNTLDYKEIEYKISSDENKSEIIKDILSFVNTWRRTDAYILLGVKEKPGQKAEVVGINDIIDDATLQQIVNSKTNKPINFSYNVINYEGKKIGIIHIPEQERPIYLKKDFGKLSKEIVYIRRGTSTAICTPDEIAKMGKENNNNKSFNVDINLEFSEISKHNKLGNFITFNTVLLKPLLVSDIKEKKSDEIPMIGYNVGLDEINRNSHYEEELIIYLKNTNYVRSIGFVLSNNSEITLNNVELVIKFIKKDDLVIYSETSYPERPRKHNDFISSVLINRNYNDDFEVNNYDDYYEINLNFNKILPKKEVWSIYPLSLGINNSKSLEFECYVYSEELPNPIIKKLIIDFKVESRDMIKDDILQYYKKEKERAEKLRRTAHNSQ